MAVMSKKAADDRSASGFLKHLALLRSERTASNAPACASLPMCLWLPGGHEAADGPTQSASADCGEFHLLVVEMGDRRLARSPAFMPKISWCLWGPEDDEPVTGGPAPSFEDAKLRAELALRAHVGARMDS